MSDGGAFATAVKPGEVVVAARLVAPPRGVCGNIAQEHENRPGNTVGDEDARVLLVGVEAQEPVPEVIDGHAGGFAVNVGGAVWIARPHDDAALTGGIALLMRPGSDQKRSGDACLHDSPEAPAGPQIPGRAKPITLLCAADAWRSAAQKCREWRA